MIKISTIIPVYNMDSYVKEAIYHWQEQTLKEKQLVVIDDCSNDNTPNILRECANTFSNIKVITLEHNLGAGPARNRGMIESEGEYISFLDADDKYIDSTSLEKMYMAAAEGNCDICGAMVSEQIDEKVYYYNRFRDIKFNGCDFVDVSYSDFQDDYYYQGFIYRKKYLNDNGFDFPDLRRNQDPPFFVKSMFYANKIRVVNTEYYLHLIEHKTVNHNIRSICDSFKGFLMNIEFADINGLDGLLTKSAYRINRTFLHLWRGIIDVQCDEFWNMALRAREVLEKHNLKVDILEYYSCEKKERDEFDNFIARTKLCGTFKQSDKIILYGAGINGKRAYTIITENNICNVMQWIDKNKSNEIIEGKIISGLNEIKGDKCDYILITPGSRRLSEEIKEELCSRGISKEKMLEWVNI